MKMKRSSYNRMRLFVIENYIQEKDYSLFIINETSSRWLVVERNEYSEISFISFRSSIEKENLT